MLIRGEQNKSIKQKGIPEENQNLVADTSS
uniref:Uncharacterized protein n=1 Tax=Arundo donax TaxID=35708 RepID=A0A0A9H2A6_ARUDO